MQKIPLSTNPNQQSSCVLNDQNCVITLRQNGQWVYLTLEVDQEKVCDGVACRDRSPLPPFSTTKFSGRLIFVDTKCKSRPNYKEFESRYILVYLTAEEARQYADKYLL